jgi:putative endonuclease
MKAMKRKAIFYVYILEASDGTYYTGYTNNLESRIKLHAGGRGSKYLRGRAPLTLVYVKEYKYLKNAMHAERTIKTYTKSRKEELAKIWANAKLSAGAPMLRFSKIPGVFK